MVRSFPLEACRVLSVLMIIYGVLSSLCCNCACSQKPADSAAEEYKMSLIFMGVRIQFSEVTSVNQMLFCELHHHHLKPPAILVLEGKMHFFPSFIHIFVCYIMFVSVEPYTQV